MGTQVVAEGAGCHTGVVARAVAHVYRNGLEIGVTTVSTGRRGHRTPTGVFVILQKDKHHHSSIYHNASMPNTQRLTWGGVCLHAGGLPGYPSSHGCVHLPLEFSAKLFENTHLGTPVIVADKASAPADVVHPGIWTSPKLAIVPFSGFNQWYNPVFLNVGKSLEDIENGDYKICEDCGEDISIERLKARPVPSFCIRCKTKRESL